MRRHLPILLPLLFLTSLFAQQPRQEQADSSRLAALLGAEAAPGFARAEQPRSFAFPADHGPHPAFRNEWWYFTGNLDSQRGLRFGYELTIFRFSLSPEAVTRDSEWRTRQVYIGHLAVTDVADDSFLVAQKFSRGAVGLAGAQSEPFRVWLENWEIAAAPGSEAWRLVAEDEDFAVDFTLNPLRGPVLNGDRGLSQKSAAPGNASYYYSIPRLETSGFIRIGEMRHKVSGLSWLDREWSTSALDPDQAGWDWFALQLSDGSDLMFYGLRKRDGSQDSHSAGTYVSPAGRSQHLSKDDVTITVQDTWPSPEGGIYPSRWRLSVPRLQLDLNVVPVMADQELFTTVRYWEGAVDVSGQRGGKPISGRGYVELTGYAD